MGFIRTLLALAVADFHAVQITMARHVFDLSWVNGEIAVETFFVISGFYMALILSGKYANRGTKAFYQARFLRLCPGYWIACLITIIVLVMTDQSAQLDYWRELANKRDWIRLVLNLLSNVFMLGQDWWRLFDPQHAYFLIPQAWTLSIEITFYLIAPWLIRCRTVTLAVFILISLLARGALFRAELLDYTASSLTSPLELVWFLLGMLSYRAYARWETKLKDAGLGLIVSAIVVLGILAFPQTLGFNFDLGQGWGIAGNYALQVTTALALPIIFAMTRYSRIDALIGEISYPLYLCHMAVLDYVVSLAIGLYRGGIILALSIVVAITLAILLAPVERWRAWLSERVRVAASDDMVVARL
jgi:peptidoglycan/LPS O-acetylase OafA/YrhL